MMTDRLYHPTKSRRRPMPCTPSAWLLREQPQHCGMSPPSYADPCIYTQKAGNTANGPSSSWTGEEKAMSHELPIILASGLRRRGVGGEKNDALASMHSSQLSFSLKQRKKKEEEGICSLVVTGMEWTGQVRASMRYSCDCLLSVLLFKHDIPPAFVPFARPSHIPSTRAAIDDEFRYSPRRWCSTPSSTLSCLGAS